MQEKYIFPQKVPTHVIERLEQPHSKESHGCPFAWMSSYHAEHALQNIRYFENAVRICKLEFPIRVWLSAWTDNIVVSFVPLEAIREPHIQEWFKTFYEIPVAEAKEKLEKYPKFPYDGRNPDTVRAEILVKYGTPSELIKQSTDYLKSIGVTIESKW